MGLRPTNGNEKHRPRGEGASAARLALWPACRCDNLPEADLGVGLRARGPALHWKWFFNGVPHGPAAHQKG